MFLPISDYHMHTPLCGHATGEPQSYAETAVKLGLKEIGFSDHAPLFHCVNPKITMNLNQVPSYHKMIEQVRAQFKGRLDIKIALEADYIPGYEEQSQALIEAYPYDYIIGSVHFIDKWGFDDPEERATWDNKDINNIYHKYFELLRKSALSGLFDIMGHVDLVKKFGHRDSEDMTDEVRETAEVFRETGVLIEINTAGLRKPIMEIYPHLDHLKIYRRMGVPLTFGSDAHHPDDVGKDFAAAADLARAAGYKEYFLFSQRNIERSVQL